MRRAHTCTDPPPKEVTSDGGPVQVHEVREDVAEVHDLLRDADEEVLIGSWGGPPRLPGGPPWDAHYTTGEIAPSNLMVVPVVNAARAEARKATRSAYSAASATRPTATRFPSSR